MTANDLAFCGVANLVHTDEVASTKSASYGLASGANEPGTRSSAGEHALHTGGVVGSIPTASTIPTKRNGDPDWATILRPFGFSPPTYSSRSGDYVRWLYFIQRGDIVKVGIAWDVKRRLHQLRAGCPDGLRLAGKIAIPSLLALQTEKKVHTALASHAIGREWFRTSPKEAKATAAPICKMAHQAADAMDQARHDLRYLIAA